MSSGLQELSVGSSWTPTTSQGLPAPPQATSSDTVLTQRQLGQMTAKDTQRCVGLPGCGNPDLSRLREKFGYAYPVASGTLRRMLHHRLDGYGVTA